MTFTAGGFDVTLVNLKLHFANFMVILVHEMHILFVGPYGSCGKKAYSNVTYVVHVRRKYMVN